MIGYASNTGTVKNLQVLRSHGWRLLLTPSQPKVREGMRYAIDNGAWGAFQAGMPFDEVPFLRLLDRAGAGADFTVVPDIVAGGLR